ncbi:MAG: 3-dehydroquinate synthase [Anaerolineales bacterium]|nr:3-dehydroquinate synthase [Anaerolineales bacterium]
MNILLAGPPGAGKSTVGRLCAQRLDQDLIDLDELIAVRAGKSIPEIFSQLGEGKFRILEREALKHATAKDGRVIALGGGALLDVDNRAMAMAYGPVICLRASEESLQARLGEDNGRPLLQGGHRDGRTLRNLLRERMPHYDSFALQFDTDTMTPDAAAEYIFAELIPWHNTVRIDNGGYPLVLGEGTRTYLSRLLHEKNLPLPAIIVSDSNVSPMWADALGEQLNAPLVNIPAGETFKTMTGAGDLYEAFLHHDLDRQSLVLAIGGGVIGDLAGFAAATFMRGVRWVNMPTTLLAMVDASIGGKVAIDLPQGKNLVGAFYPPALVLSDPEMLTTLPPDEYRSGLAEVLKHGLIADAKLFNELRPTVLPLARNLLRRALEVKIEIVQRDPYEKGERAKLNLGHTIGHGIEAASGYTLRHGEAIAIGILAETRLAVRSGIAQEGLSEQVEEKIQSLGLPTTCPNIRPKQIRALMTNDKKKRDGGLTFALPTAIGAVEYGLTLDESLIAEVITEVVE